MHDIDEGTGNVFADLGVPDADDMMLKSSMVIQLRRLMETRKLSQTATAQLIGVKQGDLSKLLRGRFRGYSVERLIKMLTALDQDVEIIMRPHLKAGEGGRVTFNPLIA